MEPAVKNNWAEASLASNPSSGPQKLTKFLMVLDIIVGVMLFYRPVVLMTWARGWKGVRSFHAYGGRAKVGNTLGTGVVPHRYFGLSPHLKSVLLRCECEGHKRCGLEVLFCGSVCKYAESAAECNIL